jgi:hypothetical protein
VLGAWKFQQGKFCNFGKSGLGFLGNFVSIFCQGRLLFFSQERATCVSHTCEEESAVTSVEEQVQTHMRVQQVHTVTRGTDRSIQSHVWYGQVRTVTRVTKTNQPHVWRVIRLARVRFLGK